MSLDQLFKSKEWLEIRTGTLRTDKVLTRIEYLRYVGYEKYSEEEYQKYLQAIKNEEEL